MSQSQRDHLVRMANQIAANMAYLGDEEAAAEVARHIRRFWARSMKQELREVAAEEGVELSPTVRSAVAQL